MLPDKVGWRVVQAALYDATMIAVCCHQLLGLVLQHRLYAPAKSQLQSNVHCCYDMPDTLGLTLVKSTATWGADASCAMTYLL
jgi:hypothetical protein